MSVVCVCQCVHRPVFFPCPGGTFSVRGLPCVSICSSCMVLIDEPLNTYCGLLRRPTGIQPHLLFALQKCQIKSHCIRKLPFSMKVVTHIKHHYPLQAVHSPHTPNAVSMCSGVDSLFTHMRTTPILYATGTLREESKCVPGHWSAPLWDAPVSTVQPCCF